MLVREGGFLTVVIVDRAYVFRVKSRRNVGREVVDYGPLPIFSGEVLPVFYPPGQTVTVPADGVLPGFAFTPRGRSFPSPYVGVYERSDMWLIPEDDRNTLFHVWLYITPSWIRVDTDIPIGVEQGIFQVNRVRIGVYAFHGFRRGEVEVIHMPGLRIGYRFGNDTNLPVRAYARFVYGEYVVEIPRNPELIFDILTGRMPSYWYVMPVTNMETVLQQTLERVYGFLGFPLYRADERAVAVREYGELLRRAKV